MNSHHDNQGFTLVELMITMAIAGMIMAAVYSAYLAQQRTSTAQRQVVEMQQNIRAALNVMMQEIRMAGYDPTKDANAAILTAGAGRMGFTQDITNNAGTGDSDGDVGDANETVTYGFATDDDASPQDGVADAGVASLGRKTSELSGFQPIAENIQAIQFRYLDEDGAATADLKKIRTVQISILARAGIPDPKFTNATTYRPASGDVWDLNGAEDGNANPPNDNYRRRLMITTVQCRNMGL
jgi:type IV pilus assembly protein PilW